MRVVMLAVDTVLDRRILLEADALSKAGHEVILIGAEAPGADTFERLGDLKIERCSARPAQNFSPRVSVAVDRVIAALNRLSGATQRFFARRVIAISTLLERFNQRDLRPQTRRYGNACLLWWREFLVKMLNALLHGYTWTGRSVYAVGRIGMNLAVRVPYGGQSLEQIMAQRACYYDPDAVHVHDLPVLAAGLAVKRRLRIPLIYDAHEFYPEQPRLSSRERARLRRQERRQIRGADRVITVNHMIAELMEARYPGVRVGVVENAVPLMVRSGAGDVDRFRQEFGIAADATILLYQGWLAPDRNLEVLVQGMVDTDPRFVLVLMGYGEYKAVLAEMAQSLVEQGRVVFVPSRSQEELLSYTASADIGLIPYPYGRDLNTHYSSPNKLYEYIAAELPMLSNELPFVRETLERYGFGCVRDMRDPDAFARAVNTFPLEQLAAMRAALAANRHLFDWSHQADRLLQLYGEIGITGHGGRARDDAVAAGGHG